jgi:hypothetical protein
MTAQKRFLSILFFMCSFASLSASAVVSGDSTLPNVSFSFPIHQHVYDVTNGLFFVGADQDSTCSNLSLAVASLATSFQALSPQSITVNSQDGQPNPLFSKKISQLALIQNAGLVAVTADNPSSMSLLYSFLEFNTSTQIYVPQPAQAKLLTTTGINDAAGNVTAGVVGLAASSAFAYAAVKKNGATFGEVGGGIALLAVNSLDKKNAVTGAMGGNLAAPLDPTTPAVKITSNLASITANMVDMYYDYYLDRLYIALQVTANGGASDGARAIVVGRVAGGILNFDAIAPDAALTGTNHIVGATGSGSQIFLFKVRTLQTSSKLSYLIVEGNNGTTGGPNIFALPLVDKTPLNQTSDPVHGTLAKFDSTPMDQYFPTYAYPIQSRGLTTQATAPADLLTNTSTQAIVGGGPLPLGTSQVITDIFARNDAVYVSIGNSFDGTTRPGVFYSQAILDSLGRIKAWTPWQRAAGTDNTMFGIALDQRSGRMWLMPGDSVTTLTVVRLTDWTNGAGDGLLGGPPTNRTLGLVDQLSVLLPKEQGGIQNFFNFSETTPGFGTVPPTANNQISMAVAVGLNNVVLCETGRNATASQFRADTGDFATGEKIFTDGTLTGFAPDGTAKIVAISGGVLGTIGPLTSAEVSRIPLSGSTTNGYLFVGGTGGVAVLSAANGAGWDTSSPNGGLHAGFVNLTGTMSFKTVGSYTNVRKLVCDGTYLYVLTNTLLDRITISSIASGPLVTVHLATLTQLGLQSFSSFSDVIVSQKLGILATSAGLYRVANGFNIANPALTSGGLGWTNVPLPEGLGTATRLLAVSPTGFDAGLAAGGMGGMLYVMGGAVSFNQARVYRFSIADVSSSAIGDATVQSLNDLFIKNVPSFFVEFGSYRNFIATEGTSLLNEISGTQKNGPLLFDFGQLVMGNRYLAKNGNPAIGALPLTSTSSVRQMLRNSASGSWLVGGSHGLFVNE